MVKDSFEKKNNDSNFDIDRLKRILVPCGLPIDGHKFVIKARDGRDDGSDNDDDDGLLSQRNCNKMGCLFVEGVGIALGYLHNGIETKRKFTHVVGEDCKKTSR